MKYLVSHQGQESGPLSIDEIVSKVRAKELELFDYVFDEAKQDWVLLMEFPVLADRLKSNKPPAPKQQDKPGAKAAEKSEGKVLPFKKAAKPSDDAHEITEWFVLKGENRFGPFSYMDLIKMLQQKVVFPFDFIWHQGLTNWQRVAESQEFNAEAIRELHAKGGKAGKDAFVERKHRRKPYKGRVLIHDNLTLWKGEGFEISRGGVGINMANSVVVPGQQVTVHFKKNGDMPAFNAICEVVSKKFVNNSDDEVSYGLRFVSLSQEVQDEFLKKVA